MDMRTGICLEAVCWKTLTDIIHDFFPFTALMMHPALGWVNPVF